MQYSRKKKKKKKKSVLFILKQCYNSLHCQWLFLITANFLLYNILYPNWKIFIIK